MNSPDINGTQKVGASENEALIKKLRARDMAAYFISYAAVVLTLACGVCLFIVADSFPLIRRFTETALGKSVAVDAFLHDRIGFLDIADFVEKTLSDYRNIPKPTVEDIINTDREIRAKYTL